MHTKHHVLILLGLLCLGALVQAVVIGHAAVPSLDAVRFVKTAQAIDGRGLAEVIRADGEQPLFAVWLSVVRRGLAEVAGDFPSIWATSAQMAAAIPLVLTLVPLYFMLRRLFDARIAIVGSILFCLLPEARRLGADGISDSTHLLLLTTALWAGVGYWTSAARARAVWLALAGVMTGLALLARAEAVILPVAIGLCLAASGVAGRKAAALRGATCHGAVYAAGLMLVLAPYLVFCGSVTPGAAIARVLGRGQAVDAGPSEPNVDRLTWQTAEGRPLDFAVKEGSIRRHGVAAAMLQYGEELADVFGYWLAAPALWALWRRRRELTRPADRFLKTFFVVYSVVLIGFVSGEGYLSARHLLPLLVVGLGVAAVGLDDLATLVCNALRARGKHGVVPSCCSATPTIFRQRPFREQSNSRKIIGATRTTWTTQGVSTTAGRMPMLGMCAVMVLISVAYLASATSPLRANRLGHREAGIWLGGQIESEGLAVLDTRGWTALYSTRCTYQYDQAKTAFCDERLAYVVVEPRELRHDSDRARTLRYLLATAGRRVAHFDGPEESETAGVTVYRWDPGRFQAASRPTPAPEVAGVATAQEERVRR